jgi:hypothetical protein
MVYRFMTFVDGSNLFGVAKQLGIEFKDYEALYRYLFEQCLIAWRTSFSKDATPEAKIVRVYWYVVGAIDKWDLGDRKAQGHLKLSSS